MKGDGLSKLYDRLTIAERFRLRIRALGRWDKADWERLDRACPYEQYRDYCARLDASDTLTLCTLVELLPLLAKLDLVDGFRPIVEYLEGVGADAAWMGYLDGYSAGWKAAGKRGEPPEVSEDDLTAASERVSRVGRTFADLFGDLSRILTVRARTSRDALGAFAENELGLPLDDLLGAWGKPALDPLARHAEALDAAEPSAEGLSLLGDVLRVAWRRHGLNDPEAEVDDDLRERYELALRSDHGADDA